MFVWMSLCSIVNVLFATFSADIPFSPSVVAPMMLGGLCIHSVIPIPGDRVFVGWVVISVLKPCWRACFMTVCFILVAICSGRLAL